jgi:hypothetical protein
MAIGPAAWSREWYGPSASAIESQLVENPSSLAIRHEIDQFNTSAARPSLFDIIRDIQFEAVKSKLQLLLGICSLVYVYKDEWQFRFKTCYIFLDSIH